MPEITWKKKKKELNKGQITSFSWIVLEGTVATSSFILTICQNMWNISIILHNRDTVIPRTEQNSRQLYIMWLGYCPIKHFHSLARTWQQLKVDKYSIANLASLCNVYSQGGKNNISFMLISALHQESNNMVVPAMQLASKIPDMSVQLWSSALLRGKLGKRSCTYKKWQKAHCY